jgi:bifunctional non-homologous end joining protein LigD
MAAQKKSVKDILVPMKASIGTPADLTREGYIFEPKLDGIRALCYVNTTLAFFSRNKRTITADYPEFDFRTSIKAKSAILDGEIVVLDPSYSPRFSLWQQGYEAIYVVFDILMLNGKSLIDVPLSERKELLDKVIVDSPRLEKCLYTTHGENLWKEMLKRHMEGVMAKSINSCYYPGKRVKVWIKIKAYKTLEAIIIGFTQEKRSLSSLVLGMYTQDKELVYIGKVGTGFSQALLEDLLCCLEKIVRTKPTVHISLKNVVWVEPRFVAEIKYLEFTKDRVLRAPVFLRLRPDKNPEEITFTDQEIRV